jgi:hypothetical protein
MTAHAYNLPDDDAVDAVPDPATLPDELQYPLGVLASEAERDKTARVPGDPSGDRESAAARPHVSVCPACRGIGRILVPDFFGPATWVECGVCQPGADDDYMPFGVPDNA